MTEEKRFWQDEYLMDPAKFGVISEADSLWHETDEDVRDGLEYGREKARLLRWVRRHMRSRLTARERHCIELLYFRGLTCREAGERTGTHPSSVHRSAQRGLAKLRRQLEKRRTCTRLRVTRFRRAAEDVPEDDGRGY